MSEPTNIVVLCACYRSGTVAEPVEALLEHAVEGAEDLGHSVGVALAGGGCDHACIPIDNDPYLTAPLHDDQARSTADSDSAAVATRNYVPRTRGFSRCRLDFSDINPAALRRGIETLQLVLRAIETKKWVAIALPPGREVKPCGCKEVPQQAPA